MQVNHALFVIRPVLYVLIQLVATHELLVIQKAQIYASNAQFAHKILCWAPQAVVSATMATLQIFHQAFAKFVETIVPNALKTNAWFATQDFPLEHKNA